MKKLWALIITALLTGSLVRAEPESQEIWWKLSVRCQNVARDFSYLSPDGAGYVRAFEEDLQVIDSALSELVHRGELVEKEFEFQSIETMPEEQFEVIEEFINDLSEDYGFFVAQELVDMGLKRRLSAPNRPSLLKVRLPTSEMKKWSALVKGKALDRSAEQDEALNP